MPPYTFLNRGTTISSVLNNTSSRSRNIEITTLRPISTKPPILSTTTTSTTEIPPIVEFIAIQASSPSAPVRRPDVGVQNVASTSKTVDNSNQEVLVEMHKMNTATFVLAGLGMLPIIVIVLYVVKQFLYRNENKDESLERYGNDVQPISPVVRLDQSDTASTTDEFMSDRDFNRNNLRFKSLLGEGNFGQVWKAEADDLSGHLGTTRIVAVKTERVDNGQGGLKAEGEIMKKLESHPNVVTLLGACIEQGEFFLDFSVL